VKASLPLFIAYLGLAVVSINAQTLPATVPPQEAAVSVDPVKALTETDLPSIEKIANDAQRELFEAADLASGPSPNSPVRKTTLNAPKLDDPSKWAKDSEHKLAVLEIKFGGSVQTVMFELYPKDTPMTVSNFLDNVETGAYKGLAFHRAIEGFIVQTGDPLSSDEGARDRWGTGGEGKTVQAEIKRTHRKGSVAMGRRSDKVNPSRRSNGYQFYFALGNYSALDEKHTVFGQVISGLEVLERISKMPVDSNDCPIARIEISNVKVIDHKGPLYLSETETNAGSQDAYAKPVSGGSKMGRFFRRIW
jgi:cyclophilin family peptidyl-prolyl cis-trans isomerase